MSHFSHIDSINRQQALRGSHRIAVPALLLLSLPSLYLHAQTTPFKHIVVIVQENRTPDNLFQGLCTGGSCSTTPSSSQYNIQTTAWLNKTASGGITNPSPLPLNSNRSSGQSYDPGHSHSDWVAMCDLNSSTGVCRMDGAAAEFCGGGSCPSDFAFHYVDNSNGILNPYLSLVKQHGWANYMFQTNQGPSFPAHQFLFGGTSAPTAADDTQAIFASDNVVNSSNLSNLNAGCLAPAGTTVAVISPSGPLTPIYPCFEHSTLADLLDPQGVTWRYYAPSAGSIWTAPNAIGHICMSTGPGGRCTSTDWKQNVDLNSADVLTDISNCKLQQVSWVIPTGNNSDHAGQNNGGGPSWVNAIVNAIGAATSCDNGAGYWQDTAIFITWDDWGGWYDHEPPPTVSGIQGDYQLGFRVPLIVVSAYTPAGFISNNKYDFGSILNYIEKNFLNQRGALTFADARALGDLSDFFTLSPMSAKKFQKVKAPKSASFFLHDKSPQTDPDDE